MSPAHAAGFSLNFSTADYNSSTGRFYDGNGGCPFGSTGTSCGGSGFINNGDPTPFYQEVRQINGTYYFHVLVGDPAVGFAQESYTRYGGANTNSTADGTTMWGAFSPDSGGNENLCTACTPGIDTPGSGTSAANLVMAISSNAGKPLAGPAVSGSGTGDPSKTVFRMVLTSAEGDMSMEVSKPFLDMKPKISQTVQDGTMSSVFVADMRGISYSDKNNPIGITNNTVIQDPTIPGGSGGANFTMANAQRAEITAGRFTYSPGTGWNNALGFDAPNASFGVGTYSYYGGSAGFDVYTVDWKQYFNYPQNALNCTRMVRNSRTGGLSTRTALGGGGVDSCPGHP